MFTPQEIQEQTFSKAVFGGYDMQQVDEFLEPLTEDYITLYKENSVLKAKMKILVEKLEEYRRQESSMQNAILAAQKTCEQMTAEAEKLSDTMPGLASFTRTVQACMPLEVTVEPSDTETTVPWTEPSKFPINTVAGWPA